MRDILIAIGTILVGSVAIPYILVEGSYRFRMWKRKREVSAQWDKWIDKK